MTPRMQMHKLKQRIYQICRCLHNIWLIRDFTYCLHFLIVASLYPWLSMHHLLVAECAPTLAAMLNIGKMLARLFHPHRGVWSQDHPFPADGNLHANI